MFAPGCFKSPVVFASGIPAPSGELVERVARRRNVRMLFLGRETGCGEPELEEIPRGGIRLVVLSGGRDRSSRHADPTPVRAERIVRSIMARIRAILVGRESGRLALPPV